VTTAFQIHRDDNVATLLDDAEDGVTLRGESSGEVALCEPIKLGHKVALADIPAGAAVIKFGIPIGNARAAIPRGAWVHLHNIESSFDARSGGFDVITGAGKDMSYE
jgi:hypothetical protein